LTLPVTGELTGTWGDTVNAGITSLLDSSIAGAAAVVMTDANYTLTSVNGAADEARQMFLTVTGTLSAARNVICPTNSKLYFIKNSTTGGFAITLKTSAGTGISVPNGKVMALQVNGTDVVDAVTYFTSLDAGSINATTLDLTNIEVTNIKAKDGTAAMQIADSTGVVSVTAAPVLTALTASQAVFTNASKVLVSNAITGTGNVVMSTSPTLVTPALGTPTALVGTNITGTASGLTAGNVTTNANLTGAVTSVGNATSLGSFTSLQLLTALTDETGTGANVFATSPTLVTPILGTPQSVTLTNGTGLPISTGVSGLGTGVATALAVNVGTAGAPVVNGGVLGTPSSGTVTNLTGTASININGTVGATTAATGNFTTLTASANSSFTSTGALLISKGATGDRPTAVSGMLRFNTTTAEFEGYNGTVWASVGGAALSNDTSTATNIYPLSASATTGTASTLYTSNAKFLYKPSTGDLQASQMIASNGIFVNSQTVAVSYTVPTGSSAMSAGPMTVASGQSVTVSSGARWVIA
jgi:hypothetical protein